MNVKVRRAAGRNGHGVVDPARGGAGAGPREYVRYVLLISWYFTALKKSFNLFLIFHLLVGEQIDRYLAWKIFRLLVYKLSRNKNQLSIVS